MIYLATIISQSGGASTSAPSMSCSGGNFFIFPAWYHYLPSVTVTDSTGAHFCSPQLTHLTDIWLIVAAVIEILLRVAALAAVAFVIMGGFGYITSQGEPDKTAKARSTITSALIGLAIAISASVIISFVAGSIH